MAYKSTLIARPGYGGMSGLQGHGRSLSGFLDDLLGGFSKGVVTQSQTTSALDLQAALAAQQGPGIGTYALVAGGAVALILLLKKKKK